MFERNAFPAPVLASVEAELGPVSSWRPVGGGCISPAGKLDVAGRSLFLKFGYELGEGFFGAEATGLEELAGANSRLKIPEVIRCHEGGSGWSWLALEWLEPARRDGRFARRLGEGLVRLHQVRGTTWGWHRDGYIGGLTQSNRQCPSWADFWWQERLAPQIERLDRGVRVATPSEWDRLRERLPASLEAAEADGPSLLHGDLWSGNALSSAAGPALVDPATYWGHREVDLAMTELFGGFDREFYDAYWGVWPPRDGYPIRRSVYQLYYLLVHVNLFGAGYVASATQTLRMVLTAS